MKMCNPVNGIANAFILDFGQDDDGELCVLTSDHSDPNGGTEKI